jgi:hypothetical protein
MAAQPRARALYAAALAQVLDTLGRTGDVDSTVLASARALLGLQAEG